MLTFFPDYVGEFLHMNIELDNHICEIFPSDFLYPMFAGLCGDKLTTIEMVLPVLLEKVLG